MRRKYNTLAELRAVRARTQRDYNQRKREERKLVRNTMWKNGRPARAVIATDMQ